MLSNYIKDLVKAWEWTIGELMWSPDKLLSAGNLILI
jgi:hypothetical protein